MEQNGNGVNSPITKRKRINRFNFNFKTGSPIITENSNNDNDNDDNNHDNNININNDMLISKPTKAIIKKTKVSKQPARSKRLKEYNEETQNENSNGSLDSPMVLIESDSPPIQPSFNSSNQTTSTTTTLVETPPPQSSPISAFPSLPLIPISTRRRVKIQNVKEEIEQTQSPPLQPEQAVKKKRGRKPGVKEIVIIKEEVQIEQDKMIEVKKEQTIKEEKSKELIDEAQQPQIEQDQSIDGALIKDEVKAENTTTTTTTATTATKTKKLITKEDLEILGKTISDYEWDKVLNRILGIGIGDIPQQSKSTLKSKSNDNFIKAIELSRDYLVKYEIPYKCAVPSFVKSGPLDNDDFIDDIIKFLEARSELNISFSSEFSNSSDDIEDLNLSLGAIGPQVPPTPILKRESTIVLDDDEDDIFNIPSFMDEVFKNSQPSDLRAKGLISTNDTNNNNNNSNSSLGVDDDSEEALMGYEDQSIDLLDGRRIINFGKGTNQSFTDNFDDIIQVDSNGTKSVEWYRDIDNRVITNDSISKDSEDWLLYLKTLEKCPLAIQGNKLIDGERLFFDIDKNERDFSVSTTTFSAYSIESKRKVGYLSLVVGSLFFTPLTKDLMRKGYLKLAGTAVLTGYDGRVLEGYCSVDFYLTRKSHITKGDHIRPNIGDDRYLDFYFGSLIKFLDTLLQGPVSVGVSLPDSARQTSNQAITTRDGFVKKNLLQMDTPSSFKSLLQEHQREGLWWMFSREQKPSVTYSDAIYENWRIYKTAEGIDFYYNYVCDKISLKSPTSRHKIAGGLLCDEMGLGKTVMSIALIMQNHPIFNPSRQHRDAYGDIREELENRNTQLRKGKTFTKPRTTLIICPATLCSQWKSEFKKHLKPEHYNQLSILDYWGPNRKKKLVGLDLSLVDIVITTHGSFGLEWKKYEKEVQNGNSGISVPPLWSIHWWRVIVDESQVCRAKTLIFKGLQNIDSIHRWCLTGTPVQNYLEEMFPMLNFLNVFPIAENMRTWRRLVDKPKNITLLKQVLNPILLRRTKDEAKETKLPQKHYSTAYLEFDEYEKEDYAVLFTTSEQLLKKIQQRRGGILKNYACVLALLLRLRQCCDHFLLIRAKKEESDSCGICFDIATNPIYNHCDHLFCLDCMEEQIKSGDGKCTQCNAQLILEGKNTEPTDDDITLPIKDELDIKDELEIKDEKKTTTTTTTTTASANKGNHSDLLDMGFEEEINEREFQIDVNKRFGELIHQRERENQKRKLLRKDRLFSTKIKQLIQDLHTDMLNDKEKEDEKCIVFSQWTSMLSLIENIFIENGWKKNIHYSRFDGTLTSVQRDRVLQAFNQDDGPRVMLMGLRCGGVGLNLTRANRVYLMDPWWNIALQNQAIGRVHRMGQKKEVYVKNYIMEESIEIRILQLQESKEELAEAIFSDDYDPSQPLKNYKLSVNDIKLLFKGFPQIEANN
ncbi:hypothetical protein DICPUDRAFT_100046 [Dictyostelium purpureum]|uniref:SNF2-related domain-containing protein n=1 Tax=Dictyostelium purpureum TaxID=5786 RepID=F1A4Z8_DICPU|nr:uncharacterized protein DICPUDRAFT_100046 [Dictyostelium purpureum]EGC28734.1 hypothetical protein DICPUDRAFT_100046 [Dictyostelium purpureum]|eukprot:XP_003294743.1 hypothetical protein DICPUDRAFT_100046 [Dictyostelium purpureum]